MLLITSLLSLTDENLLDNEELGIGINIWATLTVLQEEMPITPLFVAVKQFYHRSTEKMLKKFTLGDFLLHDLLVLTLLRSQAAKLTF